MTHPQNPVVSLVMPAYNEADVISTVVQEFADVLSTVGEYEIVIVDDHSTDNTLALLKAMEDSNKRLRVIELPANQGHGAALARAFREAKGDFIFHSDSDRQLSARDFPLLWRGLKEKDYDIIIGQRAARKDPFARLLLTKLVRFFLGALLGLYLPDSNSPFRIYTRNSLDEILPTLPEKPLVPSILMLIGAARLRKKIGWVPVSHTARSTGKSFSRSWKIFKLCMPAVSEILSYNRTLKQKYQQ